MNKNDQKRRQFILNENLWKVVFAITAPIALYNGFNYIYGLIDTILVSKISSTAVSSVAYLDQIKTAISTLGAGLAAGGSIIVARYLGAGKIDDAKKNANTLTILAVMVAAVIILITVPLAVPILKLANTPNDLIAVGSAYFMVQMVTLAVIFFNNVFIGLQKAKGSAKSILYYNLIIMATKLSLSLFFVLILKTDRVELLAVATLIAQSVLAIIGLFHMFNKTYLFKLSFKDIKLKRSIILPIFFISFPIFLGKFIFSMGKVVVNSISASYGSQVVGALGVSNQLGGAVTGISNSVEESGAAIISQNLGNKNIKRALSGFKITTIYTMTISIVGFILISIFMRPLASLYDKKEASYISNSSDSSLSIKMTFDYSENLLDFSYKFSGNNENLTTNFNEYTLKDNLVGKNLEELKSLFASATTENSDQVFFVDLAKENLDKVLIDYTFTDLIVRVFNYERWGILFLGFSAAVLALLYGFGYTKLTMVLNLMRLFVFRIPTLLILKALITLPEEADQQIKTGASAVGTSMMISNIGIGVMSLITSIIVVNYIKKHGFKDKIIGGE